jgi:hypothetical protein
MSIEKQSASPERTSERLFESLLATAKINLLRVQQVWHEAELIIPLLVTAADEGISTVLARKNRIDKSLTNSLQKIHDAPHDDGTTMEQVSGRAAVEVEVEAAESRELGIGVDSVYKLRAQVDLVTEELGTLHQSFEQALNPELLQKRLLVQLDTLKKLVAPHVLPNGSEYKQQLIEAIDTAAAVIRASGGVNVPTRLPRHGVSLTKEYLVLEQNDLIITAVNTFNERAREIQTALRAKAEDIRRDIRVEARSKRDVSFLTESKDKALPAHQLEMFATFIQNEGRQALHDLMAEGSLNHTAQRIAEAILEAEEGIEKADQLVREMEQARAGVRMVREKLQRVRKEKKALKNRNKPNKAA